VKTGSDRTVRGRGAGDPVEAVRPERQVSIPFQWDRVAAADGAQAPGRRRWLGAGPARLGGPACDAGCATAVLAGEPGRGHYQAGGTEVGPATDSALPQSSCLPRASWSATPTTSPPSSRSASARRWGGERADGCGWNGPRRPWPDRPPEHRDPAAVASPAHARAAERIGAMPWHQLGLLPVHPATRGPGGSANADVGERA
jgi:hypothetical protein